MPKSERPKNRKIKLVGGGYRWTRQANEGTGGGSLRSMRRSLRNQLKEKNLTAAQRTVIKQQLKELLARKDGR